MQLNKQCLRCGTTTNLDTFLKVTIEEKAYEVAFCTQHGDTTTPKQAKDLISKKLKEYADTVEKMKSFGIDMSNIEMSAGGIAIPKAEPAQSEPAQSEPTIEQTTPSGAPKPTESKMKVIIQPSNQPKSKTTEIIRGQVSTVRPITGVAKGAANSVNVEGHNSINVAESINKEMQKSGAGVGAIKPASKVTEEQMVRGRGGHAMRIPHVIKHNESGGGGNTVINVVDTGGDKLIQDRVRGLRDVIYNYGEKGYDVQNCTLCGGSGIAPSTGGSCPKCSGIGFLNKGWG